VEFSKKLEENIWAQPRLKKSVRKGFRTLLQQQTD
jgi:hypothetical protein